MPRQPYKEIIKAEVARLDEDYKAAVVEREKCKAEGHTHRMFDDTGKAHFAECRENFQEGLAHAYNCVLDRLNECLVKAEPEPDVETRHTGLSLEAQAENMEGAGNES